MITEMVLGESLEVLIDHRGKTPKKLGVDFVRSGVPVASAINVKGGQLDLDEARHLDQATFQRWMSVRTQAGDVLLTSEAPLGRVARIENSDPLVIGQRLFVLRGRQGVLDSGYLYYALQAEQVQSQLAARSTGTTVLGIRQSALRKVVIPAPAYPSQQAIAGVLGALDDKIAANNRMLELIDQLCQSSVAIATTDVSTSQPLRELALLKYGKALPATLRVPGPVTVYGSGGITGSHSRSLVDGPGIVVGRKGTIGAIHWADGPHFPIDTTYYVEPVGGMPAEVLYFLMRRLSLDELNSDSAVPGLNRDEAYAQWLRVPPQHYLGALSTDLRGRLALMKAVRAETGALSNARTELLPLLMTGRARVRELA